MSKVDWIKSEENDGCNQKQQNICKDLFIYILFYLYFCPFGPWEASNEK